ncbi:MAG: AAA domain-containing protein [Cyanobacteria bacterium P01_D01_bin.1]
MKDHTQVDCILDAWLEFIQAKMLSEAKVSKDDVVLEGICLRQNTVRIDKALFLKQQKTYQLNKRTSQGKSSPAVPWRLSFPQIYTVEKGESAYMPLFGLDIAPILSGEHQPGGWDINQLSMTEVGENLLAFSQLEAEEMAELVTKEGLHRFLKTTFDLPFDSFEDWMQRVPSSRFRIVREPYFFNSRGSGFSKNLQADLKAIRQCKNKPWVRPEHPAYHYLFGAASTTPAPDTYRLGAFPTNPPTDSQVVALKRAKTEVMTAVQGPPGSGKTTLILHAIAQQIVRRAIHIIENIPDTSNLTLVASSNNRAVDNVIEKLHDFKQPSQHLPVPFLYLEGGAKNRKIDKPGGAAEQLSKAKAYISSHPYDVEISERCAVEIGTITTEIKEKAAEYERIKQQRKQDEAKEQQLKQDLDRLQQAMVAAQHTTAQLQSREKRLASFDQLPKDTYEYIQTQFKRAQMQLPGRIPRWIRWFFWLLGKTEPQIIAKALTERCQQAIQETQGVTLPMNRAQLTAQLQRVEESLAKFRELQTIRTDLREQAIQARKTQENIQHTQAQAKIIEQRLSLKIEDFYQTFHIKYHEQNKTLFYLSQQFLLQEALRQKEVVLQSLSAYEKMLGAYGSGKDTCIEQMAPTLNEQMKALSLLFPVITSSLLSVRNMLPWVSPCIDLTIIDEAGMVLLHDAFPPLVKTQRALVVGDPFQIEPIVSMSDNTLKDYRQKAFLDKGLTQKDYALYSPSELETATAYHRAASGNEKGELTKEVELKEHFRCQQSIIDYCSDIAGYHLVCKTKSLGSLLGSEKGRKDGTNLLAYHVEGQIRNQVNVDEVQAVYDIFAYLVNERGYHVEDIGVVSPFSAHAKALRARLKKRFRSIEEDAIGTVHKFQGSEKRVMIFSTRVCQRENSLQWMNRKPNILNVAVSRAKELFILVGNLPFLERGRFTRKLIEHTKEHGVVLEYKTEAEVSLNDDSVAYDSVIQNCEHINAFLDVLDGVQQELLLAVPRIGGSSAIQFIESVKAVLERGVKVTVIYGTPSQRAEQKGSPEQKLKKLFDRYDYAKLVRVENMGTNQRLLLCDDEFAIAGSWNWLSHVYASACARKAIDDGVQIRKETSFRLTSAADIQRVKDDFRTMQQ